MMKPLLIGLMGYAGSGKSTVARILMEHHGFAYGRFAGPLKAMLAALLHNAGENAETIERMIDGNLKDLPSPALSGRSPRHAMQTLGTEWGRDCMAPDFWLDQAEAGIDRHLSDGIPVVLDDVRFGNEADLIRAKGGVVLLVKRPGIGPVNQHVSDNIAIKPDGVLLNDGPIQVLQARVQGWVDRLSRSCQTTLKLVG